jgi:hypothetical protein
MTKSCPECSGAVADGARFCPACGSALTTEATQGSDPSYTVRPEDALYRCRGCSRLGPNPNTCTKCKKTVELVPASERNLGGFPRQACARCGTPAAGGVFCDHCGSQFGPSQSVVIPSDRLEILTDVFTQTGISRIDSTTNHMFDLMEGEQPVAHASSDRATIASKLRLGIGVRPNDKGNFNSWLPLSDFLISNRRMVGLVQPNRFRRHDGRWAPFVCRDQVDRHQSMGVAFGDSELIHLIWSGP